jgi:hypothetical protein
VNDIVDFLSRGPSQAEIAAFRLSPSAIAYLHELLAHSSAGTATPDEQRELDQMVLLDDILSLIRARAHGDAPSAASA